MDQKQISDEMTEPNPDDIQELMIQKATELFKVCDKENNGVISKRDMQRLRSELPLSPEQLEEVFDSLDIDQNGYLTLQEFIDGFGSFLGMKPSSGYMEGEEGESQVYEADDDNQADVEKQFQEMMSNVGAKRFFTDDETIKALWVKLRSDEPELVGEFEDFLNRVTINIKQSENDLETLETALRQKSNAHDEEVSKLYEEMETQIKSERDRILKEERAREKQLREEMEAEIFEKDRQLQELLQKHQEMEDQLSTLNMTEAETKQENERLLKERERLQELVVTSQENLEEAKTYISQLRQQDKLTSKERARANEKGTHKSKGRLLRKEVDEPLCNGRRAALKMTEGIAMERESLVKQLDHLRDMNRQLRDDKDEAEAAESRRDPSPLPPDPELQPKALTESESMPERTDAKSRRKELTKQGSVLSSYFPGSVDRRHGSRSSQALSEDVGGHLADIDDDDIECDEVYINNNSVDANNLNSFNGHAHGEMYSSYGAHTHVKSEFNMSRPESREDNWSDAESEKVAKGHNSRYNGQRGQPVGATATVENSDGGFQPVEPKGPERIFKVVFVGDSGVGKSSFIYQFCHNSFKSTFSATIGVDFQIKTMMSEGKMIALQLWDTAGQERFRSITKQYFRKADGVIIMYDVTAENSFLSIRNWMNSVKEGVDDDAVIVIVGNKTDLAEEDDTRVIRTKDGIRLSEDYSGLFFETSAKNGNGIKETMESLASILKEKEDRSIENALKLQAGDGKKKGCCGR